MSADLPGIADLRVLGSACCNISLCFSGDMRQWYDWLQQAFRRCPSAVAWFIDYVTEDPHMYLM